MKTLLIKISMVSFGFMLLLSSNNIKAQSYEDFYVDSIAAHDTAVSCSFYTDTVRIFPPVGAVNNTWIINNYHDTIHSTNLILSCFPEIGCFQHYQGPISFYSSNLGVDKLFYLSSYAVAINHEGATDCSNTVQLNAKPNYKGQGTTTFSWFPTTGLNDPFISNPLVTVNGKIAYTVTAVSPKGCVDTTTIEINPSTINAPSICAAGVDTTNKNMIIWEKPVSTAIDSFYIYKETEVTNVYSKIGAVDYSDYNNFVDQESNPDIQSNKYKVSILDVCGHESDMSQAHKTMHLLINRGQDNVFNLIWEPYEGFTVSTYKIYRGTTAENLELIGTSPASNTQYSDVDAPAAARLYYQVEIISPNQCSVFKSASLLNSRSNIVKYNLTGINESNENNSFYIAPNPADQEISITCYSSTFTNGEIEILSLNGQILMKSSLDSKNKAVNISGLKSGLYIVRVRTIKGVFSQKLVKN